MGGVSARTAPAAAYASTCALADLKPREPDRVGEPDVAGAAGVVDDRLDPGQSGRPGVRRPRPLLCRRSPGSGPSRTGRRRVPLRVRARRGSGLSWDALDPVVGQDPVAVGLPVNAATSRPWRTVLVRSVGAEEPVAADLSRGPPRGGAWWRRGRHGRRSGTSSTGCSTRSPRARARARAVGRAAWSSLWASSGLGNAVPSAWISIRAEDSAAAVDGGVDGHAGGEEGVGEPRPPSISSGSRPIARASTSWSPAGPCPRRGGQADGGVHTSGRPARRRRRGRCRGPSRSGRSWISVESSRLSVGSAHILFVSGGLRLLPSSLWWLRPPSGAEGGAGGRSPPYEDSLAGREEVEGVWAPGGVGFPWHRGGTRVQWLSIPSPLEDLGLAKEPAWKQKRQPRWPVTGRSSDVARHRGVPRGQICLPTRRGSREKTRAAVPCPPCRGSPPGSSPSSRPAPSSGPPQKVRAVDRFRLDRRRTGDSPWRARSAGRSVSGAAVRPGLRRDPSDGVSISPTMTFTWVPPRSVQHGGTSGVAAEPRQPAHVPRRAPGCSPSASGGAQFLPRAPTWAWSPSREGWGADDRRAPGLDPRPGSLRGFDVRRGLAVPRVRSPARRGR